MLRLLLALSLLAGTAHAVYCENFAGFSPGTDLSAQPNWYKAGTGSLTADTSATFGSVAGKLAAGGGAWFVGEYRGGWTDIDYTVRLSNPAYVFVRTQNISGIFPNTYYVRFDSGTVMRGGKMCGGNNYDSVSATVSVSLTDVTLRVVMSGLVMTAYANGSHVFTKDFTGDVSCSFIAYNSGGLGFQHFSGTTYFDDISVNGSCVPVASSQNVLSPYVKQGNSNFVTPRWWLW